MIARSSMRSTSKQIRGFCTKTSKHLSQFKTNNLHFITIKQMSNFFVYLKTVIKIWPFQELFLEFKKIRKLTVFRNIVWRIDDQFCAIFVRDLPFMIADNGDMMSSLE